MMTGEAKREMRKAIRDVEDFRDLLAHAIDRIEVKYQTALREYGVIDTRYVANKEDPMKVTYLVTFGDGIVLAFEEELKSSWREEGDD